MRCIPIKWLFMLGICALLLIFIKQKRTFTGIYQIRDIILHGKPSYCPIQNVHEKFASVYYNGSYRNHTPSQYAVNSWFPSISTDKVNFENVCNTGQEVDLLIVITSSTAAKSVARRKLARTTWLNIPVKSGSVKFVFVLGLVNQRISKRSSFKRDHSIQGYTHFEFYGLL